MKLIPLALAAASCAVLAACSSPASSPAPAVPAAEQQAIASMAGHCSQDPSQLAAMIKATHDIEVKAGITDESTVQLAQHLATAVASYSTPVDCSQPFAAYATLRESGQG